ncbi:MAG: hypothetical protein R3E14_13500 [Erythrobacter sp.]
MAPLAKFLSLSIGLALAGCGRGEVSPEISEQGGKPVECALAGAADFARNCMIVVESGEDTFLIRHSDGGFRRFALDPETGWQVADGSAQLEIGGGPDTGSMEFSVGKDRYLVPITELPGGKS